MPPPYEVLRRCNISLQVCAAARCRRSGPTASDEGAESRGSRCQTSGWNLHSNSRRVCAASRVIGDASWLSFCTPWGPVTRRDARTSATSPFVPRAGAFHASHCFTARALRTRCRNHAVAFGVRRFITWSSFARGCPAAVERCRSASADSRGRHGPFHQQHHGGSVLRLPRNADAIRTKRIYRSVYSRIQPQCARCAADL